MRRETPHVRRLGRRRVVSGEPAASDASDRRSEPTREDLDEGWSQAPEGDHDEWLRAQRPPHWG